MGFFQDEKRFVLSVGGGALGAGLLAAAVLWPLKSGAAEFRTKSDRAKKDIEAALSAGGSAGDALAAIDRETQALTSSARALEGAVTLRPRAAALPKSPDVVYLRGQVAEAQQALNAIAGASSCELPADYGFPPGEIPKERIPALLRRLDAVRLALEAAVRSDVSQVVSILQDRAAEDTLPKSDFTDPLIERDLFVVQCRGTARSIASMLHALQQDGSFLGIVRVEIKKEKPDAPFSEASLALTVLSVREKPLSDEEEAEEEDDSGPMKRTVPGR
ncbi:MAG: hypothetical protein HYY93_00415 [Planctomycetes bacterium]|nr:hypothetical protein [Planctomycetota bacterium]